MIFRIENAKRNRGKERERDEVIFESGYFEEKRNPSGINSQVTEEKR